ncbi:MAG: MFS transporter [Bacteroidales bacterium]|nr:MFS transporter [Bacteroidales bacterium]
MKIRGLRWWILGLIIVISIINYLDRGTLNYMWFSKKAAPQTEVSANAPLQDEYIGISLDLGLVDKTLSIEEQQDQQKKIYALINIIFMICYGMSQLFSGKLYDKIGTRKGFVTSVAVWGTADALASTAVGFKSMAFFRGLLGLGEAGPWPGTTKSNAEWFPQKERALAQGLFGAAASIGSVMAPVVISMLFLAFGWKITFVTVGCLGLVWILPWIIVNKKGPKEHPWITDKEREYILSGQPEAKINAATDKAKSFGQLLRKKESYSVVLGRLFLDPIWWMFVTWLPIYLLQAHSLNIKEIAATAWIPYLGAAIGSIAGGWMSGSLIKRGYSVNYSRKAAMLTGGIITLAAMLSILFVQNVWVIVILMAFVLGGYQFTMTNIQTIPSDLLSGKSVGSLAGLGGIAAVIGTISCMFIVPALTSGGNWTGFFIMLAALVPLSLGSIMLAVRKIEHKN